MGTDRLYLIFAAAAFIVAGVVDYRSDKSYVRVGFDLGVAAALLVIAVAMGAS